MRWKDIKYDVCRWFKFWWQRRTRGWDDSDIWNLDTTIAKFVLPRLKVLKISKGGWPGALSNEEEWLAIVDDMIYAMEAYASDACGWFDPNVIDEERVKKGMALFAEYFGALWT